ncbi:MAG: hypothetical protein JO031_02270 [Ktedonobacteraceae bacterium]|nr:hypothetical protein [Ktedonobacteraceae bacterium]
MKRSDSGDFCVLYVEPDDEKSALFQKIMEQKKPVVIMLAEQARVFQRPEDFTELKHIRRSLDMPVLFVAHGSERLVHLAGRNGFPVYLSMDALVNALKMGQVGRQRSTPRRTIPLGSGQHEISPGKTTSSPKLAPAHTEEAILPRKTVPLLYETWAGNEYDGGRSGYDGHRSGRDRGVNGNDGYVGGRNGGMSGQSGYVNGRDGGVGGREGLINRAPTDVRGLASSATENRRDAMVGARFVSPQLAPSRSSGHDIPTLPTRPLISAPPPPEPRPRRNRLAAGVLVLLLIALVTAGLGYFLIASHNLPTDAPAMTNVVLGHVTFVSSNQISESSSQGLNDEVMVDLNGISQPAAGKSYYAWLLGDKGQSDMSTMLLGTLSVANGHAHLLYPGDANHTNLLGMTSRFLVTEEDAATAPLTPSPDYSAWCYYGEFSQTPINAPDNTKHFSYLDHLRHLLAADPTLDELELPGGLNTWLYRNVSKILEWTGSTRDQWQDTKDPGFVRRQTLRTLTYLDGVSFVARDLPPNTGLNVNERLARIGLLNVDGPAQDPPGYLSHVSKHLYGLLEAKTVTDALRTKVAAIIAALDNVKSWLVRVHHDALQIMNMSDKQLRQPGTLTLLNDMIANATNAFTGQPDPGSGQMREGVTWIHDQIQSLATLNVEPMSAASGRNGIQPLQMVPNPNVRRASVRGGNV